jgi:chloride channel protein, CIC family
MTKQTSLLIDSIILGIIGALGARLFDFLLGVIQKYTLQYFGGYIPSQLVSEGGGGISGVVGSHGLIFVPLVIIVGGIISGFLVYSLAPEAEGHGTDTVVGAFHQNEGKIRNRVTPIKLIASAITIGTGGAAGKEGPTALFSAGIGSTYASVMKKPDNYRRTLILIGMAAGLSAIFRSPIGTAIFGVEVLYSEMEFESTDLIYTMLASIIAYAVNGIFVGFKPLFQVPAETGITQFSDYFWYILLGLTSGVIGTAVPNIFYGIRDLFHKIPIKPHFKPAIGALGVGLIALAYPQVLGGGYGWIESAIKGEMVLSVMLILIFAKMIAFAFTVSSGGSGGVFAPTLYLGAMLGGTLSIVFHQPHAAFAVVGMAAVFGSAARVPIATLLMVTEMTGGYKLLVPAALSVILAFLVQGLLTKKLKYKSLYEKQVNTTADSPVHVISHLRTIVKLISERNSFKNFDVGHLNFISLLKSGIPLDLPGNKKLFIGSLRKKSPCVGSLIRDYCLYGKDKKWEIAGILREQKLIIPHPDMMLESGDQLIIFGTASVVNELKNALKVPGSKK